MHDRVVNLKIVNAWVSHCAAWLPRAYGVHFAVAGVCAGQANCVPAHVISLVEWVRHGSKSGFLDFGHVFTPPSHIYHI